LKDTHRLDLVVDGELNQKSSGVNALVDPDRGGTSRVLAWGVRRWPSLV